MTRFDEQGGFKSPEEWTRLAFQKTAEDGLPYRVIGGLILAGIAATAVSPVTGVLVLGYTILSSIQTIKTSGRNQSAITEFGCVAHMLDDSEFKLYASQVQAEQGVEALHKELRFALENGFEINNAALEYLEDKAPQLLDTKIPYLPASTTSTEQYQPNKGIDLIPELTKRIKNLLIIGTPGSGKGMLLANLIRAAKAQHPDLKVFVIDPKADPAEAGYFEGAADVVKSFPCERAEPETVVVWLEECFKQYYDYWEQHRRVLLVMDEGTLTGFKAKSAKSDVVKNTILGLASAGDSQGRNIYLTSLSPFVGDLGLNLNSTSQLGVVAIVKDPGVLKQWSRASTIEKIEVSQLNLLIEESECDRAVYSNGQWYAMPKLHNYSSFDRDNRKPTGDALSTEQRQQLRDRTVPDSQTDLVISKLEKSDKTLDSFIKEDLGVEQTEIASQVKLAIITALQSKGRHDLIKKFGLGTTQ